MSYEFSLVQGFVLIIVNVIWNNMAAGHETQTSGEPAVSLVRQKPEIYTASDGKITVETNSSLCLTSPE